MSCEVVIEVIAVVSGISGIGLISLFTERLTIALMFNTLAALGFGYLGYISGHAGVVVAQTFYGLFSIAGIIKQLRKGDH